jgi:hypothetical protein
MTESDKMRKRKRMKKINALIFNAAAQSYEYLFRLFQILIV